MNVYSRGDGAWVIIVLSLLQKKFRKLQKLFINWFHTWYADWYGREDYWELRYQGNQDMHKYIFMIEATEKSSLFYTACNTFICNVNILFYVPGIHVLYFMNLTNFQKI